MSINTMNQEQKLKNNTAQTTSAQTTSAQTIPAKKAIPSLAELLTPTRQPEAAPIIIAPRVDNIDITIVLGDQKNSHMSFYGGEVFVDDLDDWDNGDGEEWEEDQHDTTVDETHHAAGANLHGAATDEVHDAATDEVHDAATDEVHDAATDEVHDAATDEVHDACATCEFTDCQAHPKFNESSRQLKEGSQQSRDTSEQKAATRQPGTMKVTEGDAALEGLPDHFKSFIKLLRHAGLDVAVKRYEQKDAREGKGENDG